jgi:chitodextrinase
VVESSFPNYDPVSVRFATRNGTAVSGPDYQSRSGTVTIPGLSTQATVDVNVVGDRTIEANTEEFHLDLTSPVNATLPSGRVSGTAVIRDNDRVSPPAAPTSLRSTAATTSTINLAWNDGSSVETSFEIQARGGAWTTWRSLGSVAANTTSFQATGLRADTAYSFQVRAVNDGGASAWSNTCDARTTSPAPPPPVTPPPVTPPPVTPPPAVDPGPGSGLPARPTDFRKEDIYRLRIDLLWKDNSSNETGFRVFLSTNGSSFREAMTTPANRTKAEITGLRPNTDYWFYVVAYNNAGSSVRSQILKLRTKA